MGDDKYLDFMILTVKQVFKRDDITADTNFETDLAAKSINIAEVMNILEDEYDVEVPYMKFNRQKTVREAADFVRELVEEE